MRAAIYARYSTELQREASIEDQHRICRRVIDERSWSEAKLYADQGLSGTSHLRPGYQAMMMDARAGTFDVLVAESLDRLSRDQEHIAALHKQLRYLGIPIVTVAEGEISELHVGLKGTMSVLFIKDLAQKTHRGLEGRVRGGKSAGGISYGYLHNRHISADGSFSTGDRAINEEEAQNVRRIFREYSEGISPRTIAARLNSEHIPGPSGAAWGASTIYGNWRHGTGILNNELYIGKMVWNRQHFIKDPATGKRQARPNPRERWVITEVPHLRIIEQTLWDAVKARQRIARRSMEVHDDRPRPERARRARYLLSGLLVCGCCDGAYTLVGGKHYGCAATRNKGTCGNRRTIHRNRIEERVLVGLKEKLLHPDLLAAFVDEYRREYNSRIVTAAADRHHLQAELTNVERSIMQIVDAIADGMYHPCMKQKMAALESRKTALIEQLASIGSNEPIRLHPGLSAIYRDKVKRLTAAPECRRDDPQRGCRNHPQHGEFDPTDAHGRRRSRY